MDLITSFVCEYCYLSKSALIEINWLLCYRLQESFWYILSGWGKIIKKKKRKQWAEVWWWKWLLTCLNLSWLSFWPFMGIKLVEIFLYCSLLIKACVLLSFNVHWCYGSWVVVSFSCLFHHSGCHFFTKIDCSYNGYVQSLFGIDSPVLMYLNMHFFILSVWIGL